MEQARISLDQERDALIREDSELSQKLTGFEGRTDARDAAADLQSTRAALLEESGRLPCAAGWPSSCCGRRSTNFVANSTGRLLERSSQVFSALTLNSFEGLRLEYGSESKGSVMLVGVRPNSRTVGVDGMSEGNSRSTLPRPADTTCSRST
ncbi:MAG: hypothetical protein QM757_46110 [Paludibaculum sp.]